MNWQRKPPTVLLKVAGRHFTEGPLEIGPEPLGWFIGDLDTVLKDGHGEVFSRHGWEEEAEVLVCILRLLLHRLYYLLHRQHPWRSQVTVLKMVTTGYLFVYISNKVLIYENMHVTQIDFKLYFLKFVFTWMHPFTVTSVWIPGLRSRYVLNKLESQKTSVTSLHTLQHSKLLHLCSNAQCREIHFISFKSPNWRMFLLQFSMYCMFFLSKTRLRKTRF